MARSCSSCQLLAKAIQYQASAESGSISRSASASTSTPLCADDLWPLGEDDDEPYSSLQQRRIEKTIHGAVDQLPEEQAQILKQVYLEGQSHSEVAEATGIPLGTVKSRVRLAMKKMKVLVE